MELKVMNSQGQAAGTTAAPDTLFGPRIQRGAGAPDRGRLPGQCAAGNAGAEGSRRGFAYDQEALAPEGTGRARAGMSSSPLWRGGGRAFPSSPDENFSHKVNKKMYRAGVCSILSKLAADDRIVVIDDLQVDSPKTKPLAAQLKGMGLDSVLIICDSVDENLYLASRNLKNVMVVEPRYADPMSLIYYKKVVLTRPAIAKLDEMWGQA